VGKNYLGGGGGGLSQYMLTEVSGCLTCISAV